MNETGKTPGQAARDLQAERDHAEWLGWMEANAYSTHPDDCEGMDEAFIAGMQAARDLAAAQDARPAPGPAEERDRLALRLHAVRAILLDENASAGDARSRAAAAAYDEVLPQPAPELAALRSPVTGLIGMWDGMRKVHAPSDGEWDDWRAVLGRLVEELASQLGALEEAAQEPRPAPGSAGVLSVSRGDGTPGGGLMAYVRTEPADGHLEDQGITP